MKTTIVIGLMFLVMVISQLIAHQLDRDQRLLNRIEMNYTLILDIYQQMGTVVGTEIDRPPHKTKAVGLKEK